jgi:hypothetical protein
MEHDVPAVRSSRSQKFSAGQAVHQLGMEGPVKIWSCHARVWRRSAEPRRLLIVAQAAVAEEDYDAAKALKAQVAQLRAAADVATTSGGASPAEAATSGAAAGPFRTPERMRTLSIGVPPESAPAEDADGPAGVGTSSSGG